MADDVTRPERGVLSADKAHVEALGGPVLGVPQENCWELDEPWVLMVRDRSEPVADGGLRIKAVGPERVDDRVAVHRGAFAGSKFSAERWRAVRKPQSHRQ